MPDICFLVFAHVRHVRQNFGTLIWSRLAILWLLLNTACPKTGRFPCFFHVYFPDYIRRFVQVSQSSCRLGNFKFKRSPFNFVWSFSFTIYEVLLFGSILGQLKWMWLSVNWSADHFNLLQKSLQKFSYIIYHAPCEIKSFAILEQFPPASNLYAPSRYQLASLSFHCSLNYWLLIHQAFCTL